MNPNNHQTPNRPPPPASLAAPARPPPVRRRININNFIEPPVIQRGFAIQDQTGPNFPPLDIPRGSTNIITHDEITENRPVLNFRNVDREEYESAFNRYYQDQDASIGYVRREMRNPYTRGRVRNGVLRRVRLINQSAAAAAAEPRLTGHKRPRGSSYVSSNNGSNGEGGPGFATGGSRRRRQTRRRRASRRRNN